MGGGQCVRLDDSWKSPSGIETQWKTDTNKRKKCRRKEINRVLREEHSHKHDERQQATAAQEYHGDRPARHCSQHSMYKLGRESPGRELSTTSALGKGTGRGLGGGGGSRGRAVRTSALVNDNLLVVMRCVIHRLPIDKSGQVRSVGQLPRNSRSPSPFDLDHSLASSSIHPCIPISSFLPPSPRISP